MKIEYKSQEQNTKLCIFCINMSNSRKSFYHNDLQMIFGQNLTLNLLFPSFVLSNRSKNQFFTPGEFCMKLRRYVVLTLLFEKDTEGRWLGECKELGTAIFLSSSLEEAIEMMKDALVLHLNTLERSGERERFFKEHGIRIQTSLMSERKISFNWPIKQDLIVQPYIHQLANA
jgi:predicted RNase H-like HicB family nuclease